MQRELVSPAISVQSAFSIVEELDRLNFNELIGLGAVQFTRESDWYVFANLENPTPSALRYSEDVFYRFGGLSGLTINDLLDKKPANLFTGAGGPILATLKEFL